MNRCSRDFFLSFILSAFLVVKKREKNLDCFGLFDGYQSLSFFCKSWRNKTIGELIWTVKQTRF
jgi:hypothetical protein